MPELRWSKKRPRISAGRRVKPSFCLTQLLQRPTGSGRLSASWASVPKGSLDPQHPQVNPGLSGCGRAGSRAWRSSRQQASARGRGGTRHLCLGPPPPPPPGPELVEWPRLSARGRGEAQSSLSPGRRTGVRLTCQVGAFPLCRRSGICGRLEDRCSRVLGHTRLLPPRAGFVAAAPLHTAGPLCLASQARGRGGVRGVSVSEARWGPRERLLGRQALKVSGPLSASRIVLGHTRFRDLKNLDEKQTPVFKRSKSAFRPLEAEPPGPSQHGPRLGHRTLLMRTAAGPPDPPPHADRDSFPENRQDGPTPVI